MKPLLALCFVLLLTTSCRFGGGRRIKGNGELVTRERSVGNFNAVEVSGPIEVLLTQGAAGPVRIATDGNLQEYIELQVSANRLYVKTRDGVNLRPRAGLKVYVTAPALEALRISGSGKFTSSARLSSPRLEVDVDGSGDVVLDVDTPDMSTDINGSGSIRLQGTTRLLRSEIHGSGDLYAYNLLSERTRVNISGSGNAQVHASKRLDIDINGSGDVSYKGGGEVNQSIHGSGNIRKAD
ncbi:head GIN domain-containing protein [Flaviaesturariibacter amylovorans]|uniref:Head GIN domain-containing protein n=1 Tax=Flaviaesturariibacter amylovorans TaxID=1084520 RepID=A0ABP8GJC9_9BACT